MMIIKSLITLVITVSPVVAYKDGERVPVYVNKVGPYFNPHETYHYYSLPVCRPDKVEHRSLTLGEVLDGDRMAVAMYDIKFNQNVKDIVLCAESLKLKDIDELRHAIEELYYFEFILDDLPIRGFIGHLEESGFLPHTHKIHLWTHLNFNIEYNGNEVITANVTTSGHEPVDLDEIKEYPVEVKFTYSVAWTKTNVPHSERLTKNKAEGFFPKSLEIHWLSILNSSVLVFLLIGFVVIILMRILRNDFQRYNVSDEENMEELDQDDYGWKIIHSDVFRFPGHRALLCSILGNGCQFLALCFGIIIMALLGMFNVHRHGSMNTAAVLLYALTCCVAGYVSNSMYKQINGEKWAWNLVLTASLFSVPFFVIWSIVNSIAWSYQSTQALPFTTVLLLMLVWLLVGFPLTVVGGIFGKNWTSGFDAPCRTKNIPREIPTVPWYRSAPVYMCVGGFLPFSAISVELYYIFATLWGREQYTLYGILFIIFVILLSVTASISIALTYFQLAAEDYRWWWRSLISAGSTGLFVFVYALFYYHKRSNMSGFLQGVQFFGYTLLACYIFFLMLGTVSFFASLKFIKYIYRNLKMD
ncbi:transmembrane 9 superfamily member 1-like [Hydractinia symbiolongicarpus]|uniref:transmembrane 9 superfamily member 1-like n=1 Tax=Hydractinia symbiolongicarpus TaxID=13093 RepID=UPI00254CE949|nr:transmembrane 9 superfamily member 1-like [Hydractinia symbiolongicarpus]